MTVALRRTKYLHQPSVAGSTHHYVAVIDDQPVAILLFSGRALHIKARDKWIAWSPRPRVRRCHRAVNNARLYDDDYYSQAQSLTILVTGGAGGRIIVVERPSSPPSQRRQRSSSRNGKRPPSRNSRASPRTVIPSRSLQASPRTCSPTFKTAPLLYAHNDYQPLMDYWAETLQDDCCLIADAGWKVGAKPREIV